MPGAVLLPPAPAKYAAPGPGKNGAPGTALIFFEGLSRQSSGKACWGRCFWNFFFRRNFGVFFLSFFEKKSFCTWCKRSGVSVLPSSLGAARAGINGRGERRGLTRSLAQGVFLKGKQEVNFEGGGETPAQQPWLFLLPVGIAEQ